MRMAKIVAIRSCPGEAEALRIRKTGSWPHGTIAAIRKAAVVVDMLALSSL
jgi:hypothetical protein